MHNQEFALPNQQSQTETVPGFLKTTQLRSKTEMDGVSAAWLLFQFSRKSKDEKAKHTIRTILPNGELKVVHIEVSSSFEKKIKKDGQIQLTNAGLPGAFAQDIFIALINSLVNKIKNEHADLIAKARTIGLKGIKLPPNCTEVYFRNKDLAELMGMTEKNSKITEALRHLHKTHITIKGCIYFNGNEQAITHETYYIPSLTAGQQIKRGVTQSEWNKAKFDEFLVKHILQGYIAEMNTEKLIKLPSGAPRKLYSLISSKVLERKGSKGSLDTVVVTKDEILNTLQISKPHYSHLSKKYFRALTETGIITSYNFICHKGVDVVVFSLPKEEEFKSPSIYAQSYFQMLAAVARADVALATVMSSSTFDIDVKNLQKLIKQYPDEEEFDGKTYPVAMLICDMILHNIVKGQFVKTPLGLLKSFLKKKELPDIKPGFVPMSERYSKILAKKEAAKIVDATPSVRDEDQKVIEVAKQALQKYSQNQKDRLLELIQSKIMAGVQGNIGWKPQASFFEMRAEEVLVGAINEGVPISDINAVIKWYEIQ